MIQILSLNKTLVATTEGCTLLEIAFEHNLDWKHACGGKGKCTTCKFRIQKGSENTYAETDAELHYRALNTLLADERLACQCKVRAAAEISIQIPKSCRLPHLHYFD